MKIIVGSVVTEKVGDIEYKKMEVRRIRERKDVAGCV